VGILNSKISTNKVALDPAVCQACNDSSGCPRTVLKLERLAEWYSESFSSLWFW